MPRVTSLSPEYTDRIPKIMRDGVLYISKKYGTAAHNCCCGCGMKIVTPLKPGQWGLTEKRGKISLWPSIGNWSLNCRSHYIISDNQIVWAGQFTESQIAANRRGDRLAREAAYAERRQLKAGIFGKVWNVAKGTTQRIASTLKSGWNGVMSWFVRWRR